MCVARQNVDPSEVVRSWLASVILAVIPALGGLRKREDPGQSRGLPGITTKEAKLPDVAPSVLCGQTSGISMCGCVATQGTRVVGGDTRSRPAMRRPSRTFMPINVKLVAPAISSIACTK